MTPILAMTIPHFGRDYSEKIDSRWLSPAHPEMTHADDVPPDLRHGEKRVQHWIC